MLPPRVSTASCLIFLAAVALLCVGCGSHTHTNYVTYEDLGKLARAIRTEQSLAESITEAAKVRAHMQQSIDDLTRRALTAKTVEERTRAILAACELDVSSLKDTLLAIQNAVGICADNLANVNTVGHKKTRVIFREGGREIAMDRDFSRGPVQGTGRSLDVVIQDDRSLFQVQLSNGETAYTREGVFHRGVDGNIVNSSGYPLLPQMTVPQNAIDVTIRPDGTVEAIFAAKQPNKALGQIKLATFNNVGGLKVEGGNLFRENKASGPPIIGSPGDDRFGELQSGFLELSNASIAEELIRITQLQAWFDAVAKVMMEVHPEPAKSPAAQPGRKDSR